MGSNSSDAPVAGEVFTKGQIVNILGFAGQMVSVTTTQSSHCGMNADTDTT